jgi:G3E family GTPase
MVTVVDAYRFWHDFSSGETLLDREQAVGEEDTREVVDLLISQIEFCDVLILNKCDLVDPEDLQQLEGVLRKLQPNARLIRSKRGQVEPHEILNTGLFDFERASQSAGWIAELQKEEHTPETDEYGISSFVFRARRPLHPERFGKWLTQWPEEVVRAKGFFWLATRNDVAMTLSQAGPSIEVGVAGLWTAALPEAERQILLAEDPEWQAGWDPEHGDRINELVFIGIDLNREQIEYQLQMCLLTDEEFAADWSLLPDPLPTADTIVETMTS